MACRAALRRSLDPGTAQRSSTGFERSDSARTEATHPAQLDFGFWIADFRLGDIRRVLQPKIQNLKSEIRGDWKTAIGRRWP